MDFRKNAIDNCKIIALFLSDYLEGMSLEDMNKFIFMLFNDFIEIMSDEEAMLLSSLFSARVVEKTRKSYD